MDTQGAVGTAVYSAEAIGGDGTRPSIVGLDERDPVTGIPRTSAIPVTLEQTDAGSGSKSKVDSTYST